MRPIVEIARARGLTVIEDACQAIGARCDGRYAGTLGDIGCFSFYPTKNLGAFGDGGLLITNDEELARKTKLLRQHGAEVKYLHQMVGGNFRLDELQAAVLRVKARHLDRWIEGRRQNARRYARLIDEAGLGEQVRVPAEPAGSVHTYHLFVVRVPHRDQLQAHLAGKGIGTGVYYPVPLHLQPCFAALGYRAGSFPEAERAALDTLALPIYPELTAEQQDYVIHSIVEFLRRQ
jgi:dTDP-4-amino-4,6-dideoxygalactose transaminase